MFREAAPLLDLTPSETRFVVQGFGNVGSWAARLMEELDAKMIAVSDASGAIRSDDGIDAQGLVDHVREDGALPEFDGVDAIDPTSCSRSSARSSSPRRWEGCCISRTPIASGPAWSWRAPTVPPHPRRTRSCATTTFSWCPM
jgi:hypothetical protein